MTPQTKPGMRLVAGSVAMLALLMVGCPDNDLSNEPQFRLRSATHWIERLGASKRHTDEWGFGPPDPKPAAQALHEIGPAAVPACVRALGHMELPVRLAAVEALSWYGAASQPAIPTLLERTRDPRWHEYRELEFAWEFTEAVAAALPAIDPEGQQTRRLLREALSTDAPPPVRLLNRDIWPEREWRAFIAWQTWQIGRVHLAYVAVRTGATDLDGLGVILDALCYEDPVVRALPADARERLAAGTAYVKDAAGRRVYDRGPLLHAAASDAARLLGRAEKCSRGVRAT